MCVALAGHTGWQLSEIKEMDAEDLMEWCDACPKQD